MMDDDCYISRAVRRAPRAYRTLGVDAFTGERRETENMRFVHSMGLVCANGVVS